MEFVSFDRGDTIIYSTLDPERQTLISSILHAQNNHYRYHQLYTLSSAELTSIIVDLLMRRKIRSRTRSVKNWSGRKRINKNAPLFEGGALAEGSCV